MLIARRNMMMAGGGKLSAKSYVLRLANARLRQRANAATTNDVSVTIKAGGSL